MVQKIGTGDHMKGNELVILDRRHLVERILCSRDDLLLVTGLGAPTWDVAALGDNLNNFYLWGGMGGAVPTALGLALAQSKRRVLVLTGDGEMLMGIGSLATVAVQKPKNLVIGVIDNQRYGETGMQRSATAFGVDIASIARGAGFETATNVTTYGELDSVIPQIYNSQGPLLFNFKVTVSDHPMILPEKDGLELKHRFRAHILNAKKKIGG